MQVLEPSPEVCLVVLPRQARRLLTGPSRALVSLSLLPAYADLRTVCHGEKADAPHADILLRAPVSGPSDCRTASKPNGRVGRWRVAGFE
jgi:hypothetical protein